MALLVYLYSLRQAIPVLICEQKQAEQGKWVRLRSGKRDAGRRVKDKEREEKYPEGIRGRERRTLQPSPLLT